MLVEVYITVLITKHKGCTMSVNANPFKTYSCRFEFSHDYTAFVVAADKQGVLISTTELKCPSGVDTYVEFCAKPELDVLRKILDDGVDLHVARQTLRQVPIKDNSLERDYDL